MPTAAMGQAAEHFSSRVSRILEEISKSPNLEVHRFDGLDDLPPRAVGSKGTQTLRVDR